jgi:hypothetical protein
LTTEQLASFRKMLNVYRWYMRKETKPFDVVLVHNNRDRMYTAFGVEQCVYGQERLWNALVRWWEPITTKGDETF